MASVVLRQVTLAGEILRFGALAQVHTLLLLRFVFPLAPFAAKTMMSARNNSEQVITASRLTSA